MKIIVCSRIAIPLFLVVFSVSAVFGQGTGTGGGTTGGGTTGGTTGGTNTGTPTATPTTPTANQGGGQAGGSVDTSGGEADINLADSTINIELSPDTRNQGFIGATAPRVVENGFVGAAAAVLGAGPTAGTSFGGGVNGGSSGGGGGGGRATTGGAAARGGQVAGFGGANQNGFSVTRRNLRSQARMSFSAPQISPVEITNRFNNTFYRIPLSQDFSGQFNVSIENRTATITGAVASQADADQLVRQLRLEPGIYKIENRLRIGN